jgi:outer membrane lipoprotein-sorting protein
MTRRCLFALAAGLALIAAGPAAALSAQDTATVQRVERYLEGVKTLAANFVQVAPDGAVSRGEFYLRRPGRLRFEYLPPVPVLIVADGIWLILNDTELNSVDRWPVFDTPLAPLLSRKIDLLGPDSAVEVVGVREADGLIDITVVDKDAPDEGDLTLTLTADPMQLVRWTVRDAQGGVTKVTLNTVLINPKLDPALFSFTDPRPNLGPQ